MRKEGFAIVNRRLQGLGKAMALPLRARVMIWSSIM